MKKQFKVGDSVRLRKNLKVGKSYGTGFGILPLLQGMVFQYTKQVLTVDLDRTCFLSNEYYYPFEMLIKVPKSKSPSV